MKTTATSVADGGSAFGVEDALASEFGADIRVMGGEVLHEMATRQWSAPEMLEHDSAASDFAPSVAMNAAGNGMAIWCKHDGLHVQLWTRRYTASDGWGPEELMRTDEAAGISFPSIAVDGRGCAIAVWRRTGDRRCGIWVNRYVPRQGWSGPGPLVFEEVGEVFDPRIAMNERGDAMVVWQHSSAERNTVWTCRHAVGTGWAPPVLATHHSVSDACAPRVAMDALGNAMVVWRQFDGASTSIWANLHELDRGWGVADVLDVEQEGTAFDPQIVMNASGTAIAMWTQSGRQQSRIHACHYQKGRGWGRTVRVGHQHDKTVLVAQLAMDDRGNALAVWGEQDGKRLVVCASRYQAGGSWSLPSKIDRDATSGAGNSLDPQLVMDGHGNAVALWQQVNGVERGIWASRYAPGVGWTHASELSLRKKGDAFEPQIVMAKDGCALALWQSWSGSHFSVFASAYR